jgi:hypothetical protein
MIASRILGSLEEVEVIFRINIFELVSGVTADAWGLLPDSPWLYLAVHLLKDYTACINPPRVEVYQEQGLPAIRCLHHYHCCC